MPSLGFIFQAARISDAVCACGSRGSRPSTLRSLWFLHLCAGISAPNTALIAVRSAFEPSMMNKRRRAGSTPCSTRCCSRSLAASAFSVAPSCSAGTWFAALNIHTHGGQHALIPEVHAIEVDDQQLHLVEAPFQQLLQRGFGSFDAFPAHRRSRHTHGFGHLWNHSAVAPRSNAV